jgi:hypothetical protein
MSASIRISRGVVGHGLCGSLGVCLLAWLAGCSDGQAVTSYGGSGGLRGDGGSGNTGGGAAGAGGANTGGATATTGAGVGEACSDAVPCRSGLGCVDGVCEPAHTSKLGDPCVIGAECELGLLCLGSVCTAAGDGELGDPCEKDGDCGSGLRCLAHGLSLECGPEGTGDVGAACATNADCYAGLGCVAGSCTPDPLGLPMTPSATWIGVTCPEEPTTDPVRAYFEVPGAAEAREADFFRLPFPNDVRIKNGTVDLTGFPTPGVGLLGYDPVKLYVDAVHGKQTGFGAYPTVTFRFSGALDYDSFKSEGVVSWVDITEGASAYGSSAGLRWVADPNRHKYVCPNSFSVRRPRGYPLEPGHTYAVWLTTAGKASTQAAIERAPNLVALLADAAPSDPVLAAVHARYAPFRAYLKSREPAVSPDAILNATVFTVGPVRDPMAALAEKARDATASVGSWVKCGGATPSPCPQAEGARACGTGESEYDEYHALVTLPVFQRGTAPYLTPADGGDIELVASPRQEAVCMALTVPKAAMPSEGWPLVVFAHGTGGSFRSHIRPEVAGALSNVSTPGGATVRFAVLGIDQVQHGPRRGGSTESPDNLFFNFGNPLSARGNPLQGASDQLVLGELLATLDVAAAETGGDAIRIDPARLVFFGHSQGGTEGSLALPFTDRYQAAVLSGNGASLMHALLTKTKPVNIAALLPVALGGDADANGQLAGGDMHPVLSLLQHHMDAADPLSFARSIGKAPLTGTGTPLFQTYGLGDTYSPPITLATFAVAGGLVQAAADPSATTPDEISIAVVPVPVTGSPTLAVRQYAPPSGRDGHFVVFDVPTANADAVRFLAMAAAGEVPAVGQ